MQWIWELPGWPGFEWDAPVLQPLSARFLDNLERQERQLAEMSDDLRKALEIDWLTGEAVHTSAIEGVIVERAAIDKALRRQLRSSGDQASKPSAAAGIAAMLTAVHRHGLAPLSHEMLFDWHEKVMQGRWNLNLIGAYRAHAAPMQVVSSAYGSRHYVTVHYEAPPSDRVPEEMERFVDWFNRETANPDLKQALSVASIAHLYFVQIHPFEDGNGRIARALAEKALARLVGRSSLIPVSELIHARPKHYYAALQAVDHDLDITAWLAWFAETVVDAQAHGRMRAIRVEQKAKLFSRLEGQINARQEKALRRLFEAEPEGFIGGLSVKKYMAMTQAPDTWAVQDLQDLVTRGALKKTGVGHHARYWLNLPTLR